jgi:RNA polymerase sigma-70 factor (ECF subfamily)
VLASLVSVLGDIDLAEDAAAEAFAVAAQRWPQTGVPGNPAGWLVTTARRKAIDRLRRERVLADKLRLLEASMPVDQPEPASIPDERLELIFLCCHPALGPDAQVALTLRAVAGLSTERIARAFLVPEQTMKRRLTRAKTKIREAGIPFRVPPERMLPERVAAALVVMYLIFNEGYGGSPQLAGEAIRLARVLAELLPAEPEPRGLLALMLLHEARRAARLRDGDLVLLTDQDRSLWDWARIDEARALLGVPAGPYMTQARIAALQLEERVDWARVAALYERLAELTGSPVVRLNGAVAVAETDGPEAALAVVDELGLDGYQYWHSTRGELLRRMGRRAEARAEFDRALTLASSEPERRHLRRRITELPRP